MRRSVIYSTICTSAIGYLFGVVFAIRAIRMSQLEDALLDMVVLTGWVGLTFAILYVPVGLVALGLINAFRSVFRISLDRRTRIYFLAWLVLGTAIAIPFLGYYYSSGVDPHLIATADSPWDLLPHWLMRVGRWVGFSALAASVLAFVATAAMTGFFRIRESDDRSIWSLRLLVGVPVLILVTWLAPPLLLSAFAGGNGNRPQPTAAAAGTGESAAGGPGAGSDAIVAEPAVGPIVVVGWDGATWNVIDPLLGEGRLPNLAGLISDGSRASLRSFEPTSSPLIWTTISTGRPPGQHGVRSQVENRFRGMDRWFFFPPSMGFDKIFGRIWELRGILDRVQITSHSRRTKAFWNILHDAGRTVGLVNWRVGWPAERVEGFNITDRVHPFVSLLLDDAGRLPAELTSADIDARMPGALEPPVTRERIETCLTRAREVTDAFSRDSKLPRELAPEEEVFNLELGLEALADRRRQGGGPLDLLGVYFYEIDGVEHRHWKHREPDFFFSATDEDVRRYGDAIDQIHVFNDLMLGRLLEHTPEDATVILLSDHGHGPVFGEFRRSGGHTHAPPGIFVISGPAARKGATIDAPTVFDIFPTLMYLSGLPVERDARGRVLLEVIDPAASHDRPVRTIEAYPMRELQDRTSERRSTVDPWLLEKLRSLGYVG